MTEYRDMMELLDENGEATLYLLRNDVFDGTAVMIWHEDEADEQAYVLNDMQSADYPTTLADACNYDWQRGEEVDW